MERVYPNNAPNWCNENITKLAHLPCTAKAASQMLCGGVSGPNWNLDALIGRFVPYPRPAIFGSLPIWLGLLPKLACIWLITGSVRAVCSSPGSRGGSQSGGICARGSDERLYGYDPGPHPGPTDTVRALSPAAQLPAGVHDTAWTAASPRLSRFQAGHLAVPQTPYRSTATNRSARRRSFATFAPQRLARPRADHPFWHT